MDMTNPSYPKEEAYTYPPPGQHDAPLQRDPTLFGPGPGFSNPTYEYLAQTAGHPGQAPPAYPTYPVQGQPQTQITTVTTTEQTARPRNPVPVSYILSLVCAVIGFVCGFWCLSIPAIVFASLAVGTHPREEGAARSYYYAGLGLWIANLVVCIVIVVFVLAFTYGVDKYNNDINTYN